jgi:uncharacterized protein (DUF433 family)
MKTTFRKLKPSDFPAQISVDTRPVEERAHILGTGIEVWEVLKTWFEVDEDWDRLRNCYDCLTEEQLRAAMAYANEHRDAIEARIAEDYTYLPESLRDEIPARFR